MNLLFKNIQDNHEDFVMINDLYHRAFPAEERAAMQYLIKKANDGKGELLGIYDENQWIGLIYVITYKELSYIFYLAIDEKYRGRGYGSSVLECMKKRYHHTIMLSIEEVDKKYENYKQREKRKQFYLKNGLKEMDFYIVEAGVKYEMLYCGKQLDSTYYDELMFFYAGQRYKEIREFD